MTHALVLVIASLHSARTPAPARPLLAVALALPSTAALDPAPAEIEPEREIDAAYAAEEPRLVESEIEAVEPDEPTSPRVARTPLALLDLERATRRMRALPALGRPTAVAAVVPAAPAASTEAAPPPAPRFEPAQPLDCPPPRYPRASLVRGESGSVLLRLDVGADGAVVDVHVETSSGFVRLDEAAEDAAYAWTFAPARYGGTSVASEVLHRVTFELRT